MMRSIVVHDIDMNHVAAMERWYWRDHAPEINRRYGPWLTRHDSYYPVDAPADARALGSFNWRVTDGWWREIPLAGPRGAMAFTVPPKWPTVAACFISAQPEHDFKGAEIQPHERQVLRWLQLWKYPAIAHDNEGDEWFFNVHAPEVISSRTCYRFFTHKTVDPGSGLPGVWPPDAVGPMRGTLSTGWNRVAELWFETFDDWRMHMHTNFSSPPWAKRPKFPFVEPGVYFVCSFLLERPVDEFWRDARGYT